LVLWRNSPVEDIHAGCADLDDGQMLAANVEVTRALLGYVGYQRVDWDTIEDLLTDPARPVAGSPLAVRGRPAEISALSAHIRGLVEQYRQDRSSAVGRHPSHSRKPSLQVAGLTAPGRAKPCRHTTRDESRCTAMRCVCRHSECAGQRQECRSRPRACRRAPATETGCRSGVLAGCEPVPGAQRPCSNTTLAATSDERTGHGPLLDDRVPTNCGTPAQGVLLVDGLGCYGPWQ
jgi:hypothetical protein